MARPSDPENPGDPEYDQLWNTSIEELNAILEDASDPLHDKAQEVAKELARPIAAALNSSMSNAVDTEALKASAFGAMPKIDMSGITAALKLFASRMPASTVSSEVEPKMAVAELTGKSSAAEVRSASEDMAMEFRRRQTESLEEMLRRLTEAEQERKDAEPERKRREKSTYVATWIAAVGGGLAAVGTVVGIIVTVM